MRSLEPLKCPYCGTTVNPHTGECNGGLACPVTHVFEGGIFTIASVSGRLIVCKDITKKCSQCNGILAVKYHCERCHGETNADLDSP